MSVASPETGPQSIDRAMELAAAAALAGLGRMTPTRLRSLLAGRSSVDAWAMTRCGLAADGLMADAEAGDREGGQAAQWAREERQAAQLAREWAQAAQAVELAEVWNRYARAGVRIHLLGRPGYPAVLAGDVQAPPVLFSLGRPEALDRPRVAVVGTRAATHYGQEVAAELGAGLAGAGVVVVSGLALGIDGSAHEGALAVESGAPPVGVAGNGLDTAYPTSHAQLWRRVAGAGAVLSEAALGAGPEAWRFPARNRIIAALAQVVVVVESHRVGGAMSTVEAAATRGVPVLAVPGSVRSPASEGTNALLAEGCGPARDVSDVLVALGLEGPGRDQGADQLGPQVGDGRAGDPVGRSMAQSQDLTGADASMLTALGWEPTSTESLLRRTGLGLGEAAVILDRLVEAGRVRDGCGWWEQVSGTPGDRAGHRVGGSRGDQSDR